LTTKQLLSEDTPRIAISSQGFTFIAGSFLPVPSGLTDSDERKVFPVRRAPKIPTTVFGFDKEASTMFFKYLGIMLPILLLIQASKIPFYLLGITTLEISRT